MTREEEILKEFENLGWHLTDGYVDFVLNKLIKEQGMFGEIYHHCYISINETNKTYSAVDLHIFNTCRYELSMKEHKLLHELFKCWGWLDD